MFGLFYSIISLRKVSDSDVERDENPIQIKRNILKRNIKDTVFTKLFGEKKYLLQLYQALHPEDTTSTEADLKTITLEPIFLRKR